MLISSIFPGDCAFPLCRRRPCATPLLPHPTHRRGRPPHHSQPALSGSAAASSSQPVSMAPTVAAAASSAAPASINAAQQQAAVPEGQPRHAVVVGAGPAGALTALHLARLGFRVTVYEKRQPEWRGKHLVVGPLTGPRMFNIVVFQRGLKVLEEAGVHVSPEVSARCTSSIFHNLHGDVSDADVRPRPNMGLLMSRGELAGEIVKACQESFPETTSFHFGHSICSLDPAGGKVQFSTEEGPAAKVDFDVLVACDGAHSATRKLLQEHDPDLQVRQTTADTEYKAFSLGSVDRFCPEGTVSSGTGTIHVWGSYRNQIAGSAVGKGLRAGLILARGVFDTLKTAADYKAYIQQHFPSIPEDVAQHISAQMEGAPLSATGTFTWCSKLASGRVALVGDSAHSVSPALGQGANAALESASVLAAALQAAGGAAASPAELGAALESYSRQRLPDAHAIVAMSLRGTDIPFFMQRMALHEALHKRLPFLIPPPAFRQLPLPIPYSALKRRLRAEASVFHAAVAAAALAAAAGVAWGGPWVLHPLMAVLGWGS